MPDGQQQPIVPDTQPQQAMEAGAPTGVAQGSPAPIPIGVPTAPGNGMYDAAAPYNTPPSQLSDKSYLAAFLFAEFLGGFGIDRFYLGEVVSGIFKLITGGGLGIWALIDVILLLAGKRKDKAGREFPDRQQHFKLTLIIFIVMIFVGAALTAVDIIFFKNLINKASNSPTTSQSTNTTSSGYTATSGNESSQTTTIGKGLTLTDITGNKLYVVISQVTPNATPQDPTVDVPDSGNQFVAVTLSIKDLGSQSVDDSVGNATTVYDAAGHSYQAGFDNVASCQSFANDSYNLSVGETNSGCEVFQVPTGDSIVKVKFTPSSGEAQDTGVWNTQ